MNVTTRVNKGHANLRNGYIKRVQTLEFWLHSDFNGNDSVMINAGNDRTGLFNGHITINAEAMASICHKFLAVYEGETQ